MVAFDKARYGIDSYLDWLKNEGLRVVEGLAIDCNTVEVFIYESPVRGRQPCISTAAAISATLSSASWRRENRPRRNAISSRK